MENKPTREELLERLKYICEKRKKIETSSYTKNTPSMKGYNIGNIDIFNQEYFWSKLEGKFRLEWKVANSK